MADRSFMMVPNGAARASEINTMHGYCPTCRKTVAVLEEVGGKIAGAAAGAAVAAAMDKWPWWLRVGAMGGLTIAGHAADQATSPRCDICHSFLTGFGGAI